MSDPREWFGEAILDVVSENLGGRAAAKSIEETSYFVNFLKEPLLDAEGGIIDERPKSYELAPSVAVVREKSEDFMKQYNDEHKVGKLDLVLFDYALEHMMRIS